LAEPEPARDLADPDFGVRQQRHDRVLDQGSKRAAAAGAGGQRVFVVRDEKLVEVGIGADDTGAADRPAKLISSSAAPNLTFAPKNDASSRESSAASEQGAPGSRQREVP
jgi:hypothetical protein